METHIIKIKRENRTYYQSKADDSFRTKYNLYLFNKVVYNLSPYLELDEFRAFKITQELVDLYTTVYWQMEADFVIQPCGMTCQAVYERIEQLIRINPKKQLEFRKDYIENEFPLLFPIEDFTKLLEQQKSCAYCGITIDTIYKLADLKQIFKKNLRGWKLEIDRKDSNLEYTSDNCVMACYWCNNAKTDEFTYEEFKQIGGEIRKIWEKRLMVPVLISSDNG